MPEQGAQVESADFPVLVEVCRAASVASLAQAPAAEEDQQVRSAYLAIGIEIHLAEASRRVDMDQLVRTNVVQPADLPVDPPNRDPVYRLFVSEPEVKSLWP